MAKPREDATERPTLATSNASLSSCLRNKSNKGGREHLANRSVSFPEDESQIVTGYLEPVNPWLFAESTTKEVVLSNYIKSCEKHGVAALKSVLNQLEKLPYGDGGERHDCLNLKGENLILESCEALEEVLKRVQFEKLNLEDTNLEDEAAVALFDMIEYYEAATQLNISNNPNIGLRGWQACSRMLKRTKCLEQLECRNTPLSESLVPLLSRALRLGTQLQVLKLENCSLAGRPVVILAAALKLNTTLKELYLAENELSSNDAAQLSGLLKSNGTLQLLDISNNCVEDIGASHLCDGLSEQSRPTGLSILVLWNNRLTAACSVHIGRALKTNNTLDMLNIGHNDLKNEFLYNIKEALTENRNLLRLGMQSTQLTSDGAVTLAQIINGNPALQRIDVRDNDVQLCGLLALAAAMKNNTSITQLDIDDCPKSKFKMGETVERYLSLLEEIRGYCNRNETGGEDVNVRNQLTLAARKISLTCDTSVMNSNRVPLPSSPPRNSQPSETSTYLQVDSGCKKTGPSGRLRSPAPSPIPSPVASPSPTRTRFQVSRVTEETPSPTENVFFGSGRTRFKVTTVSDSSDESSSPTILVPQLIPSPQKSPAQITVTSSSTPPSANSTPPRTRKFSSWMSPSVFGEAKAMTGIDRLLGLFQNPFSGGVKVSANEEPLGSSRRGDAGNNNNNGTSGGNDGGVLLVSDAGVVGATWPQATAGLAPSTPVQSANSAPSLSALAVIKPTG